jgi:DNA-directed RNA polymerase specialized sigma24 family protein
MATPRQQQEEDLTRRVYSYFIFRLRQPENAEELTRLSFERIWQQANLSRQADEEPDLPVFAAARAVIAENPRPRGATKVEPSTADTEDVDGGQTRLPNDLVMAMGRLHGREREAIALRFGAELSVGEIAELIDRPAQEVKQRLARGVRSLIDLGLLPKESRTRKSAAERPRAGGTQQGEAEKRDADD